MSSILIIAAVFVCVATLVGAVALTFRSGEETAVESRLKNMTGKGPTSSLFDNNDEGILSKPLDNLPGKMEEFAAKFLNLQMYIDQAGLTVSPQKIVFMMIGLGFSTGLVTAILSPFKAIVPIVALVFAVLPLGYVFFMRKRRLQKFSAQLPDTLELISRALRAGHSLPAGIQLVAEQMSAPIGPEFARCYEEQNLGIPLEEALEEMTRRVPNVDLRFFCTAIVLQRTTGGDLSEILDKIGRLIRERFQIFGQIAALTGEGRLSGIVLLALPPVLFCTMLKLNYDYVMMLFDDPLGQKMLVGAIVMQLIGAFVIKKIIDIKV